MQKNLAREHFYLRICENFCNFVAGLYRNPE